jgi:hypothetical protein
MPKPANDDVAAPAAAAPLAIPLAPVHTPSDLSRACAVHVERWGFGRVQLLTFVWACLVWICSASLVGTAIPVSKKGCLRWLARCCKMA